MGMFQIQPTRYTHICNSETGVRLQFYLHLANATQFQLNIKGVHKGVHYQDFKKGMIPCTRTYTYSIAGHMHSRDVKKWKHSQNRIIKKTDCNLESPGVCN